MIMLHTLYEIHRQIYRFPAELRFLHCIVILCDCMMKSDSEVQGGCYSKLIGDTLQICKILKPGEKFSRQTN